MAFNNGDITDIVHLEDKMESLDVKNELEMLVLSFTAQCEEERTLKNMLRLEPEKPIPRDPMEIPFVRWVVKFLTENGFVQLASQYKTSFFIALNKLSSSRDMNLMPWLHSTWLDQVLNQTNVVSNIGLVQESTGDDVREIVEDEDRADLYHRCLCGVSDEKWLELTKSCQEIVSSGKEDELLSQTTYTWIQKNCGKRLLDNVITKLTSNPESMSKRIARPPSSLSSSPFRHAIGTPDLLKGEMINVRTPELVDLCSTLKNLESQEPGSQPRVEGEISGKMADYLNSLRRIFIESMKSSSDIIWDDLQLSYMKFLGQRVLDEKEKKARLENPEGRGIEDEDRPPPRPRGGRLLIVDLTFKLYLAIQLSMPLEVAKEYEALRMGTDIDNEGVGADECGCKVLTEVHEMLLMKMTELVRSGQLSPIYDTFNSLHWIQYYNGITSLIETWKLCGEVRDCTFLLPQTAKEFQVMNDAYRYSLQQCVPHDAVVRRLELDYQQPLFGTANLLDELGKYVLIVMRGGKIILGYVMAVDQHTNVVLGNSLERIHVGDSYGEIPVGTFLIRGDNIVLLCEVDMHKEVLLPSSLKKVTAGEILTAQREEMLEKEKKKKKMLDVFKQYQLPYFETHEEEPF